MNPPASSPFRVLVAEDDACTARLFILLLEKENYQIEQCSDGQTALQMLNQLKFDAVILDLMMPQMDGMQVLKSMRLLPGHYTTPVIIMTAARLKLIEEEANRYGAKRYLDKTQTKELVEALREIQGHQVSAPRLRMASLAEEPAPTAAPAAPSSPTPQPKRTGIGRLFGG